MASVTPQFTLRGGLIALPPAPRLVTRARKPFHIAGASAKSPGPTAEPEEIPTYFQPPPSAEVSSGPQVYQAVPQYPVAPPPVAAEPSFWSSVPPLLWIGVGVLLANVFSSAMNFVKGGPQKMQEMAMQQMMNQMMKQAMKGGPGGAPGANPFGFPPPGAAGASPFGAGFPSGFPGAGFPPSPGASQPPIDTTAAPASKPPAAASPSAAAAAAAPPTPPPSSTGAAAAAPSSSSSKRKSAFVDIDASPVDTAASPTVGSAPAEESNGSTGAPPPPPTFNFDAAAGAAAAGGFGAGAGAGMDGTGGMLDMLKNPEMQKMLYPYLPEPMRNPETFEWMLNSPEYRAQLEGMLNQQMGGAAPQAVQELMKDVDMSPDKMKAQFDALGMSPEQFVQKVMSDPELATSMTKPSVMAAIAECTKNPMNIFKYQNDEEVMRVFEKMSTLFPQAAAMGGGGFPGMPPQPPSQ